MVFRLFWLGVIEATHPELCPSFFQVDLAPSIVGFLGRDSTPSPLGPATLGSLRHDNTSLLTPEILEFLSDDSRHLARPPPTLSFPVPSTLANTHPATPARPISPTVQLAGNHQDIATTMVVGSESSRSTLASNLAMQRGPRIFAQSWSYCAYASILYNSGE